MRIFPETANQDARRLVWAKGLRAVADGYVSILLPAYLLALGHDAFEVGVLTTATLLGSAALTLFAGVLTARFVRNGVRVTSVTLQPGQVLAGGSDGRRYPTDT